MMSAFTYLTLLLYLGNRGTGKVFSKLDVCIGYLWREGLRDFVIIREFAVFSLLR